MSKATQFDVIVVGGGPAGSACATLLARAGLRVLLCEKRRFPRDKICGECVNPACWELFEQLGVAERLRALEPAEIRAVRVTTTRGETAAVELALPGPHPFFAVPRRLLDTVLLEQAQAQGAVVRQNTRVVAVRWEGSQWRVLTRSTARGVESAFTGAYLVGADGRNSLVAKCLARGGTARVGKTSPAGPHARVGVQWHTRAQPEIAGAVEMFLLPTGYAGVVNVGGDLANIALVTEARHAASATRDFEAFLRTTLFANAAAAERLPDVQPVGPVQTAYPIDPRTRTLRHTRALLVGDAHRTMEPFTGEGIYLALRDGVVAAERLLRQFGAESGVPTASGRSRVLNNRLFSAVLRHPGLANRMAHVAARFPTLPPLALKAVIRNRP